MARVLWESDAGAHDGMVRPGALPVGPGKCQWHDGRCLSAESKLDFLSLSTCLFDPAHHLKGSWVRPLTGVADEGGESPKADAPSALLNHLAQGSTVSSMYTKREHVVASSKEWQKGLAEVPHVLARPPLVACGGSQSTLPCS